MANNKTNKGARRGTAVAASDRGGEPKQRGRSLTVPLIFIGTLGAGWYYFSPDAQEVNVRQDSYVSLEDCQKDWGDDPNNCQSEGAPAGGTSTSLADNGGSGSGSHANSYVGGGGGSIYRPTSHYHGPRYYWQRDSSGSGRPMAVAPDGSTRPISGARITPSGPSRSVGSSFSSGTVSRGGFGSSAGHFSAGG